MDPVATAVQQLAENVGGEGGRSGREPIDVMEAFRETYTNLQRYCHMSTVEELPLWNRLARGGKGEQDKSILQQELT
jgi:hypothetical protein